MWPGISQRRRSFQSCDSSTWSTILCTCELPSYGLTKRRPRRAHWQPTRRGPVSASAGLVSWAWHRLCMGISAICLVRRLGWTSLAAGSSENRPRLGGARFCEGRLDTSCRLDVGVAEHDGRVAGRQGEEAPWRCPRVVAVSSAYTRRDRPPLALTPEACRGCPGELAR